MQKDIGKFASSCLGCATVSKQDPPPPMARTTLPDEAWQGLAMDFLEFKEIGIDVLVLIDYYSRFVILRPMKKTDGSHVIEELSGVFQQWAHPVKIRADNGPPFNGVELRDFLKKRNVVLENTIPIWPQMNGEVERQNRGITRALRVGKVEGKHWKGSLEEYIDAYNSRPHSVTGKAPMELMTGRKVKGLLPMWGSGLRADDDEVRERDAVMKLKGKVYADKRRRAKESNISMGDSVLLKNTARGKLQPNFLAKEFKVIALKGCDATVESSDGVRYRRHVSFLKKRPTEEQHIIQEDEEQDETGRQQQDETMGELPAKRTRRAPKRLIEEMKTLEDTQK